MRSICKSAVLILALFFTLTGCTHNYVWTEYPIDPARIALPDGFAKGREIRIVKGTARTEKTQLLNREGTQYYASEQSFTDAIADQLAKELQGRQLNIRNTAERSLEVAVGAMDFDCGMIMCVAVLDFKVVFGNGKTRSYKVQNSSPAGFDGTCNGAVAQAVIEIINDQEVLAYIKG